MTPIFFLACALEDDVELRLLFGSLGGCTGGSARSGRNGDRGSGGNLEGLLELLDELGELEQRQFLERVEPGRRWTAWPMVWSLSLISWVCGGC